MHKLVSLNNLKEWICNFVKYDQVPSPFTYKKGKKPSSELFCFL